MWSHRSSSKPPRLDLYQYSKVFQCDMSTFIFYTNSLTNIIASFPCQKMKNISTCGQNNRPQFVWANLSLFFFGQYVDEFNFSVSSKLFIWKNLGPRCSGWVTLNYSSERLSKTVIYFSSFRPYQTLLCYLQVFVELFLL